MHFVTAVSTIISAIAQRGSWYTASILTSKLIYETISHYNTKVFIYITLYFHSIKNVYFEALMRSLSRLLTWGMAVRCIFIASIKTIADSITRQGKWYALSSCTKEIIPTTDALK